MKFSLLAATLLLSDPSFALVVPSRTLSNQRQHQQRLKGANGDDDFSYQLLAQPVTSSKRNPVSAEKFESTEKEDKVEAPVEDEPTAVPEPVPLSEVTDNTPPQPAPVKRQGTRRFIPLQESTFSSISRAQTVAPKNPVPTSSGTVMMKPRISAAHRNEMAAARQVKKPLFVVTDEMGRPIHPEPTPAPKGLFEVRDEMGNIIPTSPPPRPKASPTDTMETKEPFAIQDEDGTSISPQTSSGTTQSAPISGPSKFAATQALFTVSGESSFGASKEILTLSGGPKKRVRFWNDVNDTTPQEIYDAKQEPMKVTDQSLPVVPADIVPVNTSPPPAEEMSIPSPAQESPLTLDDEISMPASAQTSSPLSTDEIPSPPSAVVATVETPMEQESAPTQELFVVSDEMGRRLNPPPAPAPKGLFEVRDEMGRIINSPAPTKAKPTPSASGNDVYKKGFSKFAATQQLFKVSGVSEFGASSEILEL